MQSIRLGSGETVLLREATKEDAPELIAYLNKIGGETDFLTFGLGELAITVRAEEALLAQSLKAKNKLMLLALLDDKVIGCLHFEGGARPRIQHTGEFGVSVLKAYWGQGIGMALVQELIRWAKATKIVRKINLRVRTDNTRAVHIYEKLGFVQEGLLTREFYVSGRFYDLYHMGLSID